MWNGGMIRRSDEGKDWCKFILDSFVSLFIQSFSCQPRKIPASECWLLTDRHYLDSIERGPIPCFNQPNNNNNQSGRRNEICHSAFVCFPTTIYSWHIACYFTCEICLQLQKVSFQNHNELETLITMLHYYTLYETAWLTRYVSPLVRAMVNLPSSLSSSPEHLVRAQGALRPVETVPLNGREFPSNKKRGACCPCPVVLWGLAQQYLVRMRNDRAHRRSLQKKVTKCEAAWWLIACLWESLWNGDFKHLPWPWLREKSLPAFRLRAFRCFELSCVVANQNHQHSQAIVAGRRHNSSSNSKTTIPTIGLW